MAVNNTYWPVQTTSLDKSLLALKIIHLLTSLSLPYLKSSVITIHCENISYANNSAKIAAFIK